MSGDRGRVLHQRVRSARRRSGSSTKWLHRHINDPYVHQARREGYRSRAAFKLLAIDDKYHLLKPDALVIDLGAAPGGWSQIAATRVGAPAQRPQDAPRVVALDVLPMDPLPHVRFLQMNLEHEAAPAALIAALEGRRPDVILSDMAAPTTGHRQTDHLRTLHLLELAVDFALSVLKPSGAFVGKTFQGGSQGEVLSRLKCAFRSVAHVKPLASRKESPELYVVARDFNGAAETLDAHTEAGKASAV